MHAFSICLQFRLGGTLHIAWHRVSNYSTFFSKICVQNQCMCERNTAGDWTWASVASRHSYTIPCLICVLYCELCLPVLGSVHVPGVRACCTTPWGKCSEHQKCKTLCCIAVLKLLNFFIMQRELRKSSILLQTKTCTNVSWIAWYHINLSTINNFILVHTYTCECSAFKIITNGWFQKLIYSAVLVHSGMAFIEPPSVSP